MTQIAWPARLAKKIQRAERTLSNKTTSSQLLALIHQDSYERMRIINYLKRKGLPRMAIIRKDLFFDIIRTIDQDHQLFLFSSLTSLGMVYADVAALQKSSLTDRLKTWMQRMDTDRLDFLNDVNESFTSEFLSELEYIACESKKLLWPKNTDQFSESITKIPISVFKAPASVAQKVAQYEQAGYQIQWLLHTDSFSLDRREMKIVKTRSDFECVDNWSTNHKNLVCCAYSREQREIFNRLISHINYLKFRVDPMLLAGRRIYLNRIANQLIRMQLPVPYDPVPFIAIGRFLVIIDQYGPFDKEVQVVQAAENYYQLLEQKFSLS